MDEHSQVSKLSFFFSPSQSLSPLTFSLSLSALSQQYTRSLSLLPPLLLSLNLITLSLSPYLSIFLSLSFSLFLSSLPSFFPTMSKCMNNSWTYTHVNRTSGGISNLAFPIICDSTGVIRYKVFKIYCFSLCLAGEKTIFLEHPVADLDHILFIYILQQCF